MEIDRGVIDKRFYERYIKERISNKTVQKKFETLLQDEDEDFIEYCRVGISNPDDTAWQFSSLWFFDIGLKKGCMPILLLGINTSSCLAMELCGMDNDEEEYKTLDELMDYVPNCSEKQKDNIKKVLEMNSV